MALLGVFFVSIFKPLIFLKGQGTSPQNFNILVPMDVLWAHNVKGIRIASYFQGLLIRLLPFNRHLKMELFFRCPIPFNNHF